MKTRKGQNWHVTQVEWAPWKQMKALKFLGHPIMTSHPSTFTLNDDKTTSISLPNWEDKLVGFIFGQQFSPNLLEMGLLWWAQCNRRRELTRRTSLASIEFLWGSPPEMFGACLVGGKSRKERKACRDYKREFLPNTDKFI